MESCKLIQSKVLHDLTTLHAKQDFNSNLFI